jgi:hypothetical protein
MLTRTEHQITQLMMDRMIDSLPDIDHRLTLNRPTGDFFYDAWEINPEFKNTVWEEILSTLPEHGEARIIKLKEGQCYTIHADIDDRWHLNIAGGNSYLVDLMSKTMYPTINHTSWFLMNAGILHSAVNFGNEDRYQLVVRKLLEKNIISEGITVTISDANIHRYYFDQIYSPWLNYANKEGIISDFKFDGNTVSFVVDKGYQGQIDLLETSFNNCLAISK